MSGTRFMTPSRSSAESFELEAHVTEQEAWLPLLHFPRVRKKKKKGHRALRIRGVCLERSVARTLYFVGQQLGG